MGLKLILGKSGSGKSFSIYEDIKKKIEEGFEGKLILIVPDQFTFEAEKNLIDIAGEKSVFKARVLNFKRLSHLVFSDLGGLKKNFINGCGRNMLLYKILKDNTLSFKTFSFASKQKGFATTISDMITELKRYDISPEELKEIENKTEDINLKNKLSDIGLIFNTFEEAIEGKYTDSEDQMKMLSEKLDNFQDIKGAEIWIDGFSSYTPVQLRVIEKLLKYSKNLNISLTIREDSIFEVTRKTEKRLVKLSMDLNKSIKYENKNHQYRFKGNEELEYLENNYFNYHQKPYNANIDGTSKTEKISISICSSPYDEIEEAAKKIRNLIMEKNFRYRDIAVVTRNLEGYDEVIRGIFSEYEIPYFLDKKKPLSDNVIITFILSALEIVSNNWSYESVFKYLKTRINTLSTEEIDLLENYVLAKGIRGKKKWIEESFSYPALKELFNGIPEEEKLEKINEIKNVVAAPFKSFYENITKGATVSKFCSAVYEFLVTSNAAEIIEGWTHDLNEKGEIDLSKEYSQIWNIVMEVLDQLVEVLGEEKVSINDFITLLEVGFGAFKVGTIPPSVDQVLVGSVERSKGGDIKALFIIGLNDGVFPMAKNDEGILNDMDRGALKEIGVEVALDTKASALEEQFLVYMTLTASKDFLNLSYPISDFEGKTLRPSIIVSRIKALFSNLNIESKVLEDFSDYNIRDIVAKKQGFNNLVLNIRKNIEDGEVSKLWQEVYRWYSENQAYKNESKRVFSGMWYSNIEDFVSKDSITSIYGKDSTFSISQFERYAQCPFSYFVHYGLKCRERNVFEISSPKIGSLLHEIIESFCEEVIVRRLQWENITREDVAKLVDEIILKSVEKIDNSIFESTSRLKYLIKRLKKVLIRTINTIAMHIKNSEFLPIGYEVEFNKSGKYPPIEITLKNGERVKVIGKIDRVDYYENDKEVYVRIIDYKSSEKNFKLSEAYYGLQLQLLVYLDAILNYENGKKAPGGEKSAAPGGILYCKIDDPMINTKKKLSDEALEIEIIKSLKMKGLLLSDVDIVKKMDKNIGSSSLIIPAGVNKEGELSKSSSAATREEFDLLRKHVKNNLSDLCEKLLEGYIKIQPTKFNKVTPCRYCDFKSVCQFDTNIQGNCYKNLKNLKDAEVFEKIKREVGGEGLGK